MPNFASLVSGKLWWTILTYFGMVALQEVKDLFQKSWSLLETVFGTLKDPAFREVAREHPSDFTRNRKLGFVDVMACIMNRVEKTTQVYLDRFRERFLPQQDETTTYTKQSFAEARQKIRPEAFAWLNDAFVKRYYAEPGYTTFLGLRVLAIDGCGMEVPDVDVVRALFGVAKGRKGAPPAARARSSQLYDVFNGITLHALLKPYRTGERAMAYEDLQALLGSAGAAIPTLILFDRGYPSLPLIYFLRYHGLHFLMRVSANFYPKQLAAAGPDGLVTLRLSAAHARQLKALGINVEAGTAITLRLGQVVLPNGTVETLVTDLGPEILPAAAMPPLYFKRWPIETPYKADKYIVEIENFSGTSPRVIAQDYHAAILFSNMSAVVRADAGEAFTAIKSQLKRKYATYRINFNLTVGNLKDRLLDFFVYGDPAETRPRYERLLNRLKRYVVPVISGRQFPRQLWRRRSAKYPMNLRRCL